jgi:hypothetical protein
LDGRLLVSIATFLDETAEQVYHFGNCDWQNEQLQPKARLIHAVCSDGKGVHVHRRGATHGSDEPAVHFLLGELLGLEPYAPRKT